MSRKRAWLLALLCTALAAAGDILGETYISRLPNHAGYYQVSVADALPAALAAPSVRPRHTVVVVLDGLRADKAAGMASVERLRAAGQCRRTDVGPLSVSRPVYAVLSTGLEQDRTGSRNNDDESPLRAESLWQVARRAGLRVTATSELPWFQQLFPDGFDAYKLVERTTDHFTADASALGDLALIHPIYVDEAGHDFGGSSRVYADNVARADRELGRLLDRLDLGRDLVVLTADHGHSDRGGHGAHSREVAEVLTCFAGHGIRHRVDTPGFETRTIAPTLAVLLQVPFPGSLRAGEDTLDDMWDIVDPGVYPAAYLANRRAAVQHFRLVNGEAVGRWLGRPGSGPGTWSELYSRARLRQYGRGLLVLALSCLILHWLFRTRQPLRSALWVLTVCALLVPVYSAITGSFDLTSLNERNQFIRLSAIAGLSTGTVGLALHFLLWRDPEKLVLDQVRFCLILLALHVAHVAAFGWPLGFPLPGQVLIFLPFLGSTFLVGQALLAIAGLLWLSRRSGGGSASAPSSGASR